MSTATLEHRLTAVRRRARQALVVWGAGWLVAVSLGALLIVCIGDWLVHFDDPILRLLFGLSILGGSAWVAVRRLVWPLAVPLSDADLALRIEGRYPGFQDSLASSVQFVGSNNSPRIGSPALQRAVVGKTLERLETLDCSDVVDTREAQKIACLALAIVFLALLLGGLYRQKAAVALERLAFPFSAPAWPRQTNLRILNADFEPVEFGADRSLKVARGDALKLYVENSTGRLPSRVVLETRTAGQKRDSEIMQPRTMTDPRGNHREVAVAQLLALKDQIEFRASGGDDDQMPWYRLEVIPPPVVERLEVTVFPPAYTRRAPERQPDGVGHVQGLIGTRVEISARASKPVALAMLRVKDQARRAAELDAEGSEISTWFIIREAGVHSWWLELKDAQGFEDAEPPRYEIRGIQDFEPEIYIEQPAADMQITPDAVVPLRTTAKDDLGIKEMRLAYKLESGAGAQEGVLSLFSAANELPLVQKVDYRWNVGDLYPESGTRIVLHTEATDEFDLADVYPEGKAPPLHIGRSVTRTLTVISREEKAQEISQRHEGLLSDLERALKLEQQAHDQIGELLSQLEKTGALRPEDLDALKRTELGQREIAKELTNPVRGLERRARDLAEELRDNQINDPDAERRLRRITDELSRVGREHLQPIEEQLTQARKLLQSGGGSKSAKSERPPDAPRQDPGGPGASQPASSGRDTGQSREPATAGQNPSPTSTEAGRGKAAEEQPGDERQTVPRASKKPGRPAESADQALSDVSQNQQAVIESLSEMLHDLSQWRGEHDAVRELSELTKQQQELNQHTAELARRTLTKSAESLSPQETADLSRLSDRQKKLAEQLEQFESRMQGNAETLSGESPATAATLRDAVAQSRDEAIAGRMRDAAGEIGENRMGQAARSQQDVLRKLKELEDTLRENHETDSELLIKKLKQAEEEIEGLRKRQAELMQRLDAAGRTADPEARRRELEKLRREQRGLEAEASRLARKLARLEARQAQASAERAASGMRGADEGLGQDDPSGAAERQQDALDDLEQAQRELARQRQSEQEQLARELLARVADDLAAMIARQQAAIDETGRLEGLRAAAGKWSRAQLASLRDLAGQQRSLAEDAARIGEKLAAAEVFALALKGAANYMERAAGLLERRDARAQTQHDQEAARQRLLELVEALKPEPPPDEPPQEQQGGGADENGQGQPREAVPTIAQVKMLISLQKLLAVRTAELEAQRGKDGKLPASARDELEAIAREQGELADLARNLSATSSPPDDGRQPEKSGGPPERKPAEGF